MEAEVTRLRTQVVLLQAQAQNARETQSRGQQWGDIPITPNLVPRELSA